MSVDEDEGTRIYYVDVVRTASVAAELSALEISPGTLVPDFTASLTMYTAVVDASVRSMTVTATASDVGATLRIEPGVMVELGVGATAITATVTAEDGITERAYVITVTRPLSKDASLSGPAFVRRRRIDTGF